jgi:hypothetical protein
MKLLYKLTVCILGIAVLSGCAATKAIPNKFSEKLPETITYSVMFESLWYELGQETAGLKSLSRYQPSDKIVKQYNLQRQEDKIVTVSGYLRKTSAFDAAAVGLFGCQITELSDEIVSFTCPVVRLPELLKAEGITGIELPTRIIIRR